MQVTVTNPGKACVEYSWAWLRGNEGDGAAAAAPSPEPDPPPSAARSLLGPAGVRSALASSARYAPSVAPASASAPGAPLFDLMPIRGVLGPGESDTLEVSFYGFPGCKAAATAVCHVVDGPDYEVRPPRVAADSLGDMLLAWPALKAAPACPVPCPLIQSGPPVSLLPLQLPLTGEASSMRFAVEPQFFDLGLTPYDRPVERDLHIANTGAGLLCMQAVSRSMLADMLPACCGERHPGQRCSRSHALLCWIAQRTAGKVPFDFSIDLGQLSRPGIIAVSPASGSIPAGTKAHIKMRVRAGAQAPTSHAWSCVCLPQTGASWHASSGCTAPGGSALA